MFSLSLSTAVWPKTYLHLYRKPKLYQAPMEAIHGAEQQTHLIFCCFSFTFFNKSRFARLIVIEVV